ncbi:MAG: CHAD domain-containing protein [Acidobacteriia bacterium]|nr:CHAD domain-containing protein [Terriglobia bacterium]
MAISAERGKSIFRKTEKELVRLSSGRRAEAVHGFRTAARRLQTLLEQLVTDNHRKHKKLLKTLNRIRKSAGKVRDVDVQLEALRSLKVPQEPRRKTQLVQALIEVRAQHEKNLNKLLKKQDIKDVRKRLRRTEGSVIFDSNRDPLLVARQMLDSVTIPQGTVDEETLHRYRLTVKRARYAAEFAPKSAESTRFLAELKRLQDALGSWHDWLTLTHTAMERLGDVSQSSLVAVLHNVTRGKFRHAVSAVTAAKTESHAVQPSGGELRAARKTAGRNAAIERDTGAAA